MNTICASCGASLNVGQAFCTSCGKPTAVAHPESPKKFCTGCGSLLDTGARICHKCGATSNADAGNAFVAAPPPTSSPGSSILLKLIAVGLALVMLFVILVMGTCGYIAYRARQKAHAIAEAYEEKETGKNDGRGRNNVSKAVPGGASAPISRPLPVADPVLPVAASGEQSKDWLLKYERTEGGPEADLVVRTGDINNLGFGWPQGFDPFSGKSTPPHPWPQPDRIPAGAPDGTDRIMLGSTVITGGGDGYSGALNACVTRQVAGSGSWVDAECKRARELTKPMPIVLSLGTLPNKINAVLIQIFADDFQPVPFHSHFQVTMNGTRIPSLEYAINSLDQTGPIGKLLSVQLLPEYWPLLQSGTVKLVIDDPTTHVPDGYAVDFVRILVNPHNFKYQVSLSATVTDADTHAPISAATVTAALQTAATDSHGKCQLSGLPAGLVTATAAAPGYDENSVPVDLVSGQSGHAEIQLHRHEESTAALERAIAQSGSAAIYGIHFDTDSAKLRSDSIPALNAVLGLIKNHPDEHWNISGHTDNQGSATHNQPLSEQRAATVVAWLKDHGLDASRLLPQGFGASRPVADNVTASGRALNRRVEVALEKPGKTD